MIKKRFLVTIVISLFLLLGIKRPVLATDPHLFLSPSSGSNLSSAFNVEIRVDTGGRSVGGVDVLLSFPKDLLRADNFTPGAAFSDVLPRLKNNEGKVGAYAFFSQTRAGDAYNGSSGLIGTVAFTPLASGTATLSFVCNPGQKNDSNIIDRVTLEEDVIVCSANGSGTYQLALAGVPTSTPTPIPTPGGTTKKGCNQECSSDSDCEGTLRCQTVSGTKRCVNLSCSAEPDCICNKACWEACGQDSECPSGLSCRSIDGTYRCVNLSCERIQNCSCGGGGTATPTPTPPVSGSMTQTLSLIGLGIFALLTGIVLRF